MNGDPIPDEERIARYCQPSQIDQGQLTPGVFMLRKVRNEAYLSVFLLDRFAGATDPEKLDALRGAAHPRLLTFSKSAVLALLQVGRSKEHIGKATNGARAIRVLHAPIVEPLPFENHGGIYDTAVDEWEMANYLLEAVEAAHPALI